MDLAAAGRAGVVTEPSVGPYRLESELGSGGMGVVWRAAGPGGPVALKLAHAHIAATPRFRERFVREGEVGRAIRHANVVATLDAGIDEGRPWIAMELVEGQTLRALLADLGRLPEELCRRLGIEMLRGLAAIHAAGVVHRDVKPDNVLVTPAHAVKIMDLGLARIEGADALTDTGAFVGTAAYASPEQFAGAREFDGRTDLHAVGVILYELASGEHPFRTDDFRSTAMRVMRDAPRPLGDANPQVSSFLEEFVHRLLAKEPSARFASAQDALDVLASGESSDWWAGRTREIRLATLRAPRAARVPRETALHGRETDLARLRDAWEAAVRGEGRVVLVEGEPGIGKTRLVEEFAASLRAAGADAHYVAGGWPPGGAATASGAFTAAWREHLGDEPESALRRALPATPALVPSFAALLRGDAPPAGAPVLTREAVQTLFVHVTRAAGAERPTLLLADDLHFAPDDGRALFAAIAAAVPGHRVMLVGTIRSGSCEAWASEIARLPHAARHTLPRLGPRELVRLLADALRSDHLAEELGGRIAVASDGNPWFVFEILRGLRESRLLARRDDGSWAATQVLREIRIPQTVRDAVESRLAEAGDDDLEILRVAACQGFTFDPILVGAVVGLAPIPLLKRLGVLEIRHRLVRAVGRRFEFDHPLVQEVLAAGLSDLHRETYHAALGDALETREGAAKADPETLDGALCAALANHFLRGAAPQRARRHLMRGLAHLAALHAHPAVADLAALAAAVPWDDDAFAARIHLRRAASLDVLGRRDEHRVATEAALARADRSGDAALRVRTRLGVVQYHFAVGTHEDEVRPILDAARDIARDAQLPLLEGEVEQRTGMLLFHAGRPLDARPRWERARDLARSGGSSWAASVASAALGHAYLAEGRYDEAYAAFDGHRRVARAAGDKAAEGAAMGNLGMVLSDAGRIAEAVELYRGQIAIAREQGARRPESIGLGNLANALHLLGRTAEARTHYQRQIELSREIGDRQGEAIAMLNLGGLLHLLGDLDGASSLLLGAAAASEALGALHPLGFALHLLATLAADRGEVAEAFRRFDEADAVRRRVGNRPALVAAQIDRAALLARIGRRDEAAAELREARDVCSVLGLSAKAALAACRLAELGEIRAEDAAAAFEDARSEIHAHDRIECLWLLFRASGDPRRLDEARRLLSELVSLAPPDARRAMIRQVPLHREVAAASGEVQP